MNCCKNPYSLCGPIDGCFETLRVYVPVDYSDETIDMVFINPANHSKALTGAEVTPEKYVDFDVTDLSDGFLNPYSGPFQLYFRNESGQQIEFTAKDGNKYDSILFTVSNLASEISTLNVFL